MDAGLTKSRPSYKSVWPHHPRSPFCRLFTCHQHTGRTSPSRYEKRYENTKIIDFVTHLEKSTCGVWCGTPAIAVHKMGELLRGGCFQATGFRLEPKIDLVPAAFAHLGF